MLLAEEYRKAAHHLVALGKKKRPLSWAPCRLSAIQAIELYLNAFLLQNGHDPTSVRGLQHNLASRCDLAIAHKLPLKNLTAAHLRDISARREYLVSRYAPDMAEDLSQINRLTATLEEIATKVGCAACVSVKAAP